MIIKEIKEPMGEGSRIIKIRLNLQDYKEIFNPDLKLDNPVIQSCVDITKIILREGNCYLVKNRPKNSEIDFLIMKSTVEEINIKIPKYPEEWDEEE